MPKAGVIHIDIAAGTAQFIVDMEKANAKLNQFGQAGKTSGGHMVSGMQASSAAIRTLEGNLANNVRAVENFLSKTLSLGPVLQAAFPVIGAIAFGSLIVELSDKVVNFFKTIQQAPEKSKAAFDSLRTSAKMANDEFQVANDRLANEIAKLEGTHQNTLKLALDEARVSADKLAESLEKDLQALQKVMKENEIGKIMGFFTGRAPTVDMVKNLFGESGFGGFDAKIRAITSEGRDKIGGAKSEEESRNARLETRNRLEAEYANKLQEVGVWIDKLNAKQAQHETPTSTVKGAMVNGVQLPDTVLKGGPSLLVPDQSEAIAQARAARLAIQEQQRRSVMEFDAVDLKKRLGADEAAKAASEFIRPFRNKIMELDAQFREIGLKGTAVGKDQGEQTYVAGLAAAIKAIDEINRRRTDLQKGLDEGQQKQIRYAEVRNLNAAQELANKEKMESTTEAIRARIAATRELTDAIGKGYEAVKKANVETQVISTLGRNYADPAFERDKKSLRVQFSADYEKEHARAIAETVDKLGTEIELEKSLAAVQAQGAEAIRLVTLAYRLREVATSGGLKATKDLISKEIELADARKATANKADLAGIEREIDGITRLGAAYFESGDAVRKAQNELKYEKMTREGKSNESVAQTRKADDLVYAQEVLETGLRTGVELRNQLSDTNRQIAAVQELRNGNKNILEIEIALRNLENQRLQIISQQLQSTGTLRNGVRAFFAEMQQQARTSGEILHDALMSALDGISDSLAKLMTTGKGNFGQMLQGIGQQILQQTIKSGIQTVLGKLAGKNAILRDGSEASRALWVQWSSKNLGPEGVKEGNGGPTGGDTRMGDDQAGGSQLAGVIPKGIEIDPVWVRIAGQMAKQGGGGIFDSFIAPLIGAAVGAAVGGIGGSAGGKSGSSESVTSNIQFEQVTPDYVSPRARGGSVRPSDAYLVGEEGPEILRGMSGRISSNSESKRMLAAAGNTYYSIDARGTDPAQTEARVRQALIAVHGSAISTSIQATADLQKRSPQK